MEDGAAASNGVNRSVIRRSPENRRVRVLLHPRILKVFPLEPSEHLLPPPGTRTRGDRIRHLVQRCYLNEPNGLVERCLEPVQAQIFKMRIPQSSKRRLASNVGPLCDFSPISCRKGTI